MRTLSEYEALKEYKDMLDDCYEPIKICGYEYSPSNALESVDPIAFDCGFNDWCDSENIEIE